MGSIAHTHDFGHREITVYSDISTHQFELTNRNTYPSNFIVLVDGGAIGTVLDVQPDETIELKVDLKTLPGTKQLRKICTLQDLDKPNVSQVCSGITLQRY